MIPAGQVAPLTRAAVRQRGVEGQVFAADGRCPEHAPYDFHPDTYLSEDLEPIELVLPVPTEN